MTTIIARQFDNRIVIAADSQVTSTRKYNHPKMAKITERGQYLIAGAGESAACDIAQHIWNPPKPTAEDKKDLYHFIISKVVPSLKACFKENDYKWEDKDDDDTKFAFLLGIGGEVFDSTDKAGKPATFKLSQVIPGWSEALQLMPVGSTWELYIPASLAYGTRNVGGLIGPNETLIFNVHLISSKP